MDKLFSIALRPDKNVKNELLSPSGDFARRYAALSPSETSPWIPSVRGPHPKNLRAGNPQRTGSEANSIALAVAATVFGNGVGLGVDLGDRYRARERPHISSSGCKVATPTDKSGFDCRLEFSSHAVNSLDGAVTLVQHPD